MRATVTSLSLALAMLLLGTAGSAQAGSLEVSLEDSAVFTVNARGSADLPSTLRVFVQKAGPTDCAGGAGSAENAQAQAARAGSTEVITQAPSGPFGYSARHSASGAGTYLVCAYLFDALPETDDHQVTLIVFADPPPPADIIAAPKPCVVPALKGRTLAGAGTLLRRAGCSVGTVLRPGQRTRRRALARGHVLRVVGQFPAPRSVRGAQARVLLRLAYVAPRRSSR